jgi:hypothetical protein
MEKNDAEKSLEPATRDHLASAARVALGMVPIAGSLLVELADVIIPNQRIDRIVEFARILGEELSDLDEKFVRSQLTNENFAGLLEEAWYQAARCVTDERRQYIASLVATSLTDEAVEYNESKHLLRILGEINDIEVIWLRFYAVRTMVGDEAFREKHANVLAPVVAPYGGPREAHEKSALQKSYKEHLFRLGLLERRYQTDLGTELPRFDRFTGGMKVRGYQLTALGGLLLRHIGLATEED